MTEFKTSEVGALFQRNVYCTLVPNCRQKVSGWLNRWLLMRTTFAKQNIRLLVARLPSIRAIHDNYSEVKFYVSRNIITRNRGKDGGGAGGGGRARAAPQGWPRRALLINTLHTNAIRRVCVCDM
ncbi:hypothetical protein EVAR_33208_1 [Eumeta japonica]|uniref:Uncharacterized protein n=1 Tax=Eumeta variegata TaxID=151549 RepID=A0A4C1W235_EUMVA|nr:hypothetical protein EVAR_33208_1 [Eumeta japonica]